MSLRSVVDSLSLSLSLSCGFLHTNACLCVCCCWRILVQGWINDENPLEKASRLAKEGFQTPIDEIDAAAGILDPVMLGLRQPHSSSSTSMSDPGRAQDDAACPDEDSKPAALATRVLHYGAFFKDYKLTEW